MNSYKKIIFILGAILILAGATALFNGNYASAGTTQISSSSLDKNYKPTNVSFNSNLKFETLSIHQILSSTGHILASAFKWIGDKFQNNIKYVIIGLWDQLWR